MWPFNRKVEKRGEVPAGSVPVSSPNFLEVITGMGGYSGVVDVPVTIDSALSVPAVWCATNFLSSTIAGLPLRQYAKNGDDRKEIDDRLSKILNGSVNDEMTTFGWRKYTFDQVFTGGRGVSFIERNARNQVINLWPLDGNGVTIERREGRKTYKYNDGAKTYTYDPSEIIDIPFMLKADGINHRGPIMTCRDAIALAIASTQYGARFFNGGGVPPFVVKGRFLSPQSLQVAADDMHAAVRKAATEKRQYLTLPEGLEIDKIGTDAEGAQLIENKRFTIEEVARIWGLSPVHLQDLTHGTYSNTEQQDLQTAKYTIKRWVEATEQEINLKIFGRSNPRRYFEFDMSGLLRGDFETRMNGYAVGIQSGVFKPNEARRRENLPAAEGGDNLMIQGATVPITQSGEEANADG